MPSTASTTYAGYDTSQVVAQMKTTGDKKT